jgi:hypothetical protein
LVLATSNKRIRPLRRRDSLIDFLCGKDLRQGEKPLAPKELAEAAHLPSSLTYDWLRLHNRAKFYSRSHDAVIRVYDEAGTHKDEFGEHQARRLGFL